MTDATPPARWHLCSLPLVAVAVCLPALVMPVEVVALSVALTLLSLLYVPLQRWITATWLNVATMCLWPVVALGLLVRGGLLVRAGTISPLSFLFVVPLALVYVELLSVVPVAVYQRYSGHSRFDPDGSLPAMTAIVPAYNEEAYVGRAIESLLAADYPADAFELVVVDDGSTDDTLRQATAYAADDRVRVLHKDNGGKYSALNYGLAVADGDVVTVIDADCIVHPDALRQLVAPLRADASVGAVAGDVRLLNRRGYLVRIQALEYALGINLVRRMFDVFGDVPVVPGCLGAYRRSALTAVDNFDPDTLTEDYDLTVKLLKAGYDVRATPARVYTEVPDTWRDLYRQRLRWYRGNLMTHLKHANVFLDPGYGVLHSITFPLRLLSMTVGTATTVLVLLSVAIAVADGAFVTVLTIFGVFLFVSTTTTLVALLFKGDDRWLLPYTVVLVTAYKLFTDAVMLKAMVDTVARSDLDWTSPTRVRQRRGVDGTVTADTGADE